MKKLILAGIIIIICCLVFLIVRQNSSQAGLGWEVSWKPYKVFFVDWVKVSLSAEFNTHNLDYVVIVEQRMEEGKIKFIITGMYYNEQGKAFLQKSVPFIKGAIKSRCEDWTAQGYPISLNDFEIDIHEMQ